MRIPWHPILVALALSILSAAAIADDPIVLASGTGENAPKQPQIALGSNGSMHVVFGIGEAVVHCSSSDAGATFSQPKPAFRVPNMSLGMRRGPRVVATKDMIVVTAVGGRIGKGRDGDILSWRSADSGANWLGPVRVNDIEASAREGLHAMAAAPDGSIWCTWLDLRDKKSEIYAARSIDGGTTWGTNIKVYESPDGSVCECCHPSIIVTDKKLSIMFRNSLNGQRDMYVTSSSDHGQTFSPARKLGQGTWTLDACPMDGGMLAAQGAERVVTVWRRDNQIYLTSRTDEKETLLGPGQQPWITANKNGTFIVWTSGREGDLMLLSPSSRTPQTLARNSRDPVVVTSTDSGATFCCWESKQSGTTSVCVQRLDIAGEK